MTFTDDDLWRLKNMFVSGTKGRVSWDQDKWLALIARLNAAEECAEVLAILSKLTELPSKVDIVVAEWRKASGK